MIEVKIKTIVTTQFGEFMPGTIYRGNDAFAKHLVEDCGAAEYIKAPVVDAPVVAESDPDAPEVVTKRGRRSK